MPIYEYLKSNKKHYYYAFEVRDVDGKRKTLKERGFTSKGRAKLAEDEARMNWKKGIHIDPHNILFGDHVSDWIKNKPLTVMSEQTKYNNEGHIRKHINPYMGHIPLSKITANLIESFIGHLQEKQLSSGTIKKIFDLVNGSLKAACKKRLLPLNPSDMMDVKPRPGKTDLEYWNKTEVRQFLNSFEHRQKIVFLLAIYTGMRQGEILGLRMRDIDFETGKIYIRQIQTFKGKIRAGAKTNSSVRMIDIPKDGLDELWNEMYKHRELILEERKSEGYTDMDLFICTKLGTTFKKHNCDKVWWRFLEKSGCKKITFHGLRHTCASLLFQTEPPTNPKVVQELLGHANIKITLDTYSHMMPVMHVEALRGLGKLLESKISS